MKINELRIGNLIYEIVDTPENPKYKDEFEIAGINAVYDTLHDANDNITLLSCCEPIPLTEEWLLKTGFFWSDCYKNYFNGKCSIKFDKTDKCYYISQEQSDALCYRIFSKLKYVHKLQNLYFELEDEELKIN